MPPENENGPGGSSRSRQGQYDQKAAEDTLTVQRGGRARHVVGQLPIIVAAAVYPPATGRQQAVIIPDDICPGCAEWHDHKGKWPLPVLVTKKARCGIKYEVALHPPRVRRARRAA